MQSVKIRVFTATIISYYTRLCKKKDLPSSHNVLG